MNTITKRILSTVLAFKQKVTVVLKKGYSITSLGFSRGGEHKNIKNGSTIRFNKKGEENTVLFINYTDPKGNPGLLRLFAETEDCTM